MLLALVCSAEMEASEQSAPLVVGYALLAKCAEKMRSLSVASAQGKSLSDAGMDSLAKMTELVSLVSECERA